MIAATNRPLEELLRQGRFRPDLYYRLNVIRIELPPLRDRRDDIVPLVDAMLRRYATPPRGIVGVSAAALRRIMSHSWPGNVPELGNVIERAVALTEHDILLPDDLELSPAPGGLEALLASAVDGTVPLDELERTYVLRVLEQRKGNKAETARVLGIDRRTLYRMLGRVREDQ